MGFEKISDGSLLYWVADRLLFKRRIEAYRQRSNKLANKISYGMLKKPKFKSCFRIEIVDPETVFILSERNSFVLRGLLYKLLAPLLDGNRTVDEIVEEVTPQLVSEAASLPEFISANANVYHGLMLLEQKGYIVESDDELPVELITFCETLKVDVKEANYRLQNTKVAVKSFGDIATSEFIGILQSLKIQVADSADFTIVLTDDYLRGELDAFNQFALESQHPWMPVKPTGTIPWLGPIFHPGKTACWECLAQRLRGNRPVERYIQKERNQNTTLTPPLTLLASTGQTALGMAATEVLKWILQGENKRLEGALVTHDFLSLQTDNHVVVKRPQCQACGEPALNREPLPLILGNRQKTFTSDGGYRSVSPEETLEKYQYHISPITGVIRELKPLFPQSKSLVRAYVAKHDFASVYETLETLQENVGGRSMGKGKTDAQAKASGFGEAIERYSGIFQGDEIRRKGSYEKMADKAIHPNACMNFSEEQYQNRHQWNAAHSSWFQKVPEPFDGEREIEWTPVWSLTAEEFKYLPTAYCYYGYPQPPKPDCWADSNGCAAGNTLEEAILQGFMELVERDCVALWWYNRLQRPRVDLDSFDDPYFQGIKQDYAALNRELWVLDIANDFNIPAFAAISSKSDRPQQDIILGFGAHLDAKIAVSRALTEVNQSLPAVLQANPDGTTRYSSSCEQLALEWWKTATLANRPYLVGDRDTPRKTYSDYPQVFSDNLREDVKACQQIVEQQGMEMLVLDQSRLDIGLKVVKVIVPGMRHFWKRLGPGRLYEVPVKLGWLERSLSENELNPFPMWL